jgi:hypothetical protein
MQTIDALGCAHDAAMKVRRLGKQIIPDAVDPFHDKVQAIKYVCKWLVACFSSLRLVTLSSLANWRGVYEQGADFEGQSGKKRVCRWEERRTGGRVVK